MAKIENREKKVKPYSTPTLTMYGRVSDLTNAVGKSLAADGGGVSFMTKTAV